MDRIGFSSSAFPETKSIEEILKFCIDNQFDSMELEINSTNFNPEKIKKSTLRWIRELGNSRKVLFSMHGPEYINFSDPDSYKRNEEINKLENSIRLSSKLGIKTVVVHPGSVVGEYTKDKLITAFNQNISAIRKYALFAKKMGVTLAIENLCHEKGSVNPDINSFFDMCKEIGLSIIGITLDTNHAGLVDGIEKTVSIIGDYVTHIHFSSNKGKKSDHCEPQAGVMNFNPIAGFLKKFNGLTIIELNPIPGRKIEGAILRTRDYLLRLNNL